MTELGDELTSSDGTDIRRNHYTRAHALWLVMMKKNNLKADVCTVFFIFLASRTGTHFFFITCSASPVQVQSA